MSRNTSSQSHGGDSGKLPPFNVGSYQIPPDRFLCSFCGVLISSASRIFPHMAAYICFFCAYDSAHVQIHETEVSNKSYAPWSEDEVSLLNVYQKSSSFLPFVCNLDHVLIPSREGLSCSQCKAFKLCWVYSWALDDSWQKIL